ncbi:glucose dehydrogenase [Leptospira semungkisensis]|uniref:Glucose dehydrogenase n=1 Tax=Leptospira semungkisensis TaxID=2484985 RepID=A0A4R9FQH2_9LEPT|nr:PQQ-dependent sugar dehydrogenase [Leptospira semungkisensis]TGK00605.1 glucose dehydrogenase [Leptospira semungkisensis]
MRRFASKFFLFSWVLLLGSVSSFHLFAKPKKAVEVTTKKPGSFSDLDFEKVASGYREPTDIQFYPDEPDTMVILEKRGKIYTYNLSKKEGKIIADFTGHVETRSEEGLLGLAFHPRFKENHLFYVNAVSKEAGKDQTLILEFKWDETRTIQWKDRRRVLLRIDQPYSNHNAGQLSFGPDGKLYIGFGDGGAGGDPLKHGQNTSTYLGTMIRIEPNLDSEAPAYKIPDDNPYKNKAGYLSEIWAYGLRNPWRFSFDSLTGDLYVADVGQNLWEEVDLILKGGNYGWNITEGFHCFSPPNNCSRQGLQDPLVEYDHETGQSITGGYVYRGKNLSFLLGWYVFADFVSGKFFAFETGKGKRPKLMLLKESHYQISTFGRDPSGELYFADFGTGNIFRLVKKN